MHPSSDRPLSKQEAIEQLRKTIGQLETIIKQLDNTSVIDLPNSSAIESLLKTTTELAQILPQTSVNQEPVLLDVPEVDEVNKQEKAKIEPLNLEQIKDELEPTKIETETIEPAPVKQIQEDKTKEKSRVTQEQKPNNKKWLFIGITAAIIIATIPLAWSFYLSRQTPQLIAQNKTLNEPTIVQPDTEPVIIDTPSLETEPALDNIPIPKTIPNQNQNISPSVPEITNKIPPELVAENRPKKVTIDTVKPKIKLNPEQNLIAALENKTNNLATHYNEDLVISIKPNFNDSIVRVTIADDWYQLLANRQDKIVEEMLKQARQLEFNKLKITDSKNNLIARSPVVGKEMVILRRTI